MDDSGHDFPAKLSYTDPSAAWSYDNRRKGLLWNLEMRRIAGALKRLDSDASFLDVPCGTGRFTVMLARRFRKVYGVDISDEMLEVASSKLEGLNNVSLAKADAEELPFQDDEFDYCLSVRFFGHTPPDVRRRVIRELARVTRRTLFLVLYARDPVITARKHIQRWLGKKPRGLWYPYASIAQARHDLRSAGLDVLQVSSLFPFVMESRLLVATKAE